MKYLYFFVILLILFHSAQAQWQIQQSGTSENLNDVAILNQTSAVVVGNNGTILRTTNSGTSWILVNSGTLNDLNAIFFRDEQNGIAVGDGIICRTTEGGDNWETNTLNNNAISLSYGDPYSSNPLGILIGCEEGNVISSNDNGVTWDDTSFSSEPVVAVDFNYSWQFTLAYALTRSYTNRSIFPSIHWTQYENPLSIEDDITGGDLRYWFQYMVGSGGMFGVVPLLLKKSWIDTLWSIEYYFVAPPFTPFDIVSYGDFLYVCGTEGKIFKSPDEGDNWLEQYTGIATNLNAIDTRYDTMGYSVGENGIILYTSNGGTSSVDETKQSIDFYLYQNYPNPFNPITTIEYEIGSRQHVQLKVFDLLGREIAILVNEEQPAGNYKIEFNPALINLNQTSGIYFYQLSATGGKSNFIQTKKMIYLK